MNEEAIFLEALQKTSAKERDRFLKEACSGDAALRNAVDLLLRAHEKAGEFLQGRPAELSATITPSPITERPGDTIGPYKLLQQIGEGGMGVVYMAEQTEPVERRVALKIIKPGMDTKQVISRFEAERQALAMMDHPNIARVLDAGTTDSGRPYFVMELVKGVPVTQYCDEQHLTPRERLELFVPICQAIQHAHQKGIIHRDLKPTNILVAEYDDKAVPKIIDFGVAKAVSQRLTEKTMFTQYGQIVGTIEYMSPEQAKLNQLDVDTRSDIYSLGVLLYELLTGETPFDKQRLRSAAFDELLRIIREEEPPRPSTRLSSSQTLPSIAANRKTEPQKLSGLVRGELDWIVMKALEKDRGRRYDTANAFARDVQRYLGDEPVEACPPSATYRFRKFAQRNRGRLVTGGVVGIAVLVAMSGIGWAIRDRAAQRAELSLHLEQAVDRAALLQREGKHHEALAALEQATLLTRGTDPSPAISERITSLQQLLDGEARDAVFVARFEAIRSEIYTECDVESNTFIPGNSYRRMLDALNDYGIVPGVTPPTAAVSLIQDRPAEIQTSLVAALDECLHYLPSDDSGSRQWLHGVLQTIDSDPWRNNVRRAWKEPTTIKDLMESADVRQQPPSFSLLMVDMLPNSPESLALVRRVQFAHPDDFRANHYLASMLRKGKPAQNAEALRYYTAALSLSPDNPGALLNRARALIVENELDAGVADLRRAIVVAPRYAAAYANLALALKQQGKLDEAVDCCRKAIEIDSNYGYAHNCLGWVFYEQRKLDEAIVCFREAARLAPNERKAPNAANIYASLAEALFNQGNFEEASDYWRKSIELDPTAQRQTNLGAALEKQRKFDEAITCHRTAIELDPKCARAYAGLGSTLSKQGKLEEAIDCYRKSIELDPKVATSHNNLGVALEKQKKFDEGATCFRTAIELDPTYVNAYLGLGNMLKNQGKLDEAIDCYRKSIELDPRFPQAHHNLGTTFEKQGKLDEAIDCYRKSIELDPKYAQAHHNLGCALDQQGKLEEAMDCLETAFELEPNLKWVRHNLTAGWHKLGWSHYRAGNWESSIKALERSCDLEDGGGCGQWIVLALAHAKLSQRDDLSADERARHTDDARRNYDRAVKDIDARGADISSEVALFRQEAVEVFENQEELKQESDSN